MQQAALRIAHEPPAPGRLFDKAPFAASAYPHLKAVFERMVLASIDNLREVCPLPPQFVFREVVAEPLGKVLDAFEDNGLAAIFMVPEWGSRILFLINRSFIFTMTEMLCGGDGLEAPFEEKRRFSQVEKNIAKAILTLAAKTLQSAMAPAARLTLQFERIETNMSLAVTEDRNDPAVVAQFDVRAFERTGKLGIVIPRSVVRSARARRSEASNDSADSAWSRQMREEIDSTDVTLRAVLEEKRVTLAEIAGLRVGQVLPLSATVESRINLECDGRPLFRCQVGQSEGRYTLRVDEVLEARSDRG